MLPFNSNQLSHSIWVATTGDDQNAGTQDAPLRTIQAALDHADPGTGIMVQAGTYTENVYFHHGGDANAPIWLESADGTGAAKIQPEQSNISTIQGYGVHDIAIQGFDITAPSSNSGDSDGIKFAQASDDFSQPAGDLMIVNNTVHDSANDGIKISQADQVYIANNTIDGVAGQGIDLVAVNHGQVLDNLVAHAGQEFVAVQVKGGSTDVLVDGNTIRDASNFGIAIGGVTDLEFMWPDTVDRYEASQVTVSHNYFDDVPKAAVIVQGGVDSKIISNDLTGIPYSLGAVYITPSGDTHDPAFNSANITVTGNKVDRTSWYTVESGQDSGLVVSGNGPNAAGADDHGTPGSSGGSGGTGSGNSHDPLTVTVTASGDQYKGAPEMRVYADDDLIGDVKVTEVHKTGQWHDYTFTDDGLHDAQIVKVEFVNDAWGGSTAKDRNLWVHSIEVNNDTLAPQDATYDRVQGTDLPGRPDMLWSGALAFDLASHATHAVASDILLH